MGKKCLWVSISYRDGKGTEGVKQPGECDMMQRNVGGGGDRRKEERG